MRPAYCS